MMNKLGLIIVSVIFALIQTGCAEQSTWMSLNSSNPRIIWEVKPQADLENITGEQISTPEFKMSDYVKGVVPGTVFTAYVEAGIVPDPNYAGKKFTVIAHNNSINNVYIQKALLNGQEYNKCYLDFADIAAGGTLELFMGDKPNVEWGL